MLTVSLHRIDNNKRFARFPHQPPREHRWMLTQEAVAAEFDADPDEVTELQEDDDVLLCVAGCPVAYQTLEGSAFRTKTIAKEIVDTVLDNQQFSRDTLATAVGYTLDTIKHEAAE